MLEQKTTTLWRRHERRCERSKVASEHSSARRPSGAKKGPVRTGVKWARRESGGAPARGFNFFPAWSPFRSVFPSPHRSLHGPSGLSPVRLRTLYVPYRTFRIYGRRGSAQPLGSQHAYWKENADRFWGRFRRVWGVFPLMRWDFQSVRKSSLYEAYDAPAGTLRTRNPGKF